MNNAVAQQIAALSACTARVSDFFASSVQMQRLEQPGVCNFLFGNPHDMPLPGFVAALGKWHVPQNKDWYAYKINEPEPRAVVARSLTRRDDMPFDPEDIFLTNGAFAGLAVALRTIIDPGDEVIFITPPWFWYEALIVASGAVPVRVSAAPESFDLDLEAIASSISARTRAIIINSPNNPTGKIYPPATLQRLAQLLTAASNRNGRPIYLLSDEAYHRILFDGRRYHSPSRFYPHTLLVYTYGKALLTPGQRLGYLAVPPTLPDREQLRWPLMLAQLVTGYAFPNALLQHALADLEQLSIDIDQLQRRRDRLVTALREQGYQLHVPEGTFYLLPRAPWADDVAFTNLLAEHDVLCLPGSIVEMPGYFRISLTATDDMVERSIPGFQAAMQQARTQPEQDSPPRRS